MIKALISTCAFILCTVTTSALAFTNKSVTPSPRVVEHSWMSIATWYRHHADDVEAAYQEDIEVVFIGDSITESWAWNDQYAAEFKRYFGQYRSVNLAIGGDQTQNLIWRLQHGAKGKLNPKVVVLMIGVNNLLNGQTAEEAAIGVGAVLEQLQDSFPNAQIINHAILPHNQSGKSIYRQQVIKANKIIAQFESEKVHFYDFGDIFLDKNGDIPKELMEDFLHPTPKGMGKLGKKLAPAVEKWINQ